MFTRRLAGAACFVACVVLGACGEPPEREMHEAQGAIDAARAAGAEQYAPAEYQAAIVALDRYGAAVADRDYRLALNHALDARERAQDAARMAADQKAIIRSEAEHALETVEATMRQLDLRLRAAEAARAPVDVLENARLTARAAEAAVQEARTALASDNYLAARDATRRLAEQLREAIRQLDTVVRRSSERLGSLAPVPPRTATRLA